MLFQNKGSKVILFVLFAAVFAFALNQVVYAEGEPIPLQPMPPNEMNTMEEMGDRIGAPDAESTIVIESETIIDVDDVKEVDVPSASEKKWGDAGKSFRDSEDEYSEENYENDVVVRTQDGNDYYFSIELALSGKEQERGLMWRKSLPEMHGMLFVFHSMKQRGFWMKNTLIPLDMIFIEDDGRIGHIHSNAQPLDEAVVSSGGDAMAVLEINGGLSDKLGLQAGDMVLHTAFKNRHME